MTSSLIDLVILGLLLGTLAFGLVLARRIARLQAALVELAPVLQAFSDAVDQGERSVAKLRAETDRLEIEAARQPMPMPMPMPMSGRARREAEPPSERSSLVRLFFETARGKVNG